MAGVLNFALSIADNNAPAVLQNTATAFTRVNAAAGSSNTALGQHRAVVQQLETATQGTTASMRAMEQVFFVFGGQIAPQVTTGVMTVTTGMQALKATATATGMSIASIGVAGLGVVGIMATLSAAVDAARAKLAEGNAETALVGSLDQTRERMLKQIQDLFAAGKLDKEEALNLQVRLALAPNSANELTAAIQEVRGKLKAVIGPIADPVAGQGFTDISKRVAADQLTGPDRVRAELDIALTEFERKVVPLGEAAGKTTEEITALLEAFRDNKKKLLNEQFNPNTAAAVDKATGKTLSGRDNTNLTGLERLGLVIGTGVGGGINDPARSTAENTRQMLFEQKRLNDLIAKNSGVSLARV